MADLLRNFKSLDVKRQRSLKTIWKLGIVFVTLVIFSFSLEIYKGGLTVPKKYSISEITQNYPSSNSQTAQTSPTPTPLYGTIPEYHQIKGGSHSFQTFNNCGPASLSMTLSFYGFSVSQKALGDELRPYQIPNGNNDDKSVTLAELSEKSKDFGFIPIHRPIGNIEIIKKFVANDIPVITRTLTKLDEDIGHFRVVFGYNEKRQELIQNDSLQGKELKFDYDEFLQLWKPYGFEFLVLIPPEKEPIAKAILEENYNEETAWKNTLDYLKNEVEKNPDDIYLQFSLSVAYYEAEDYEKSVETFEKVENQLLFRTLWYQIEPLLAYQKLDRYEKLLPQIENILNNGNRAFSELYQIRGEIYFKQGKKEEAKGQFEKAIYYNKNYEPAKKSLQNL